MFDVTLLFPVIIDCKITKFASCYKVKMTFLGVDMQTHTWSVSSLLSVLGHRPKFVMASSDYKQQRENTCDMIAALFKMILRLVWYSYLQTMIYQ